MDPEASTFQKRSRNSAFISFKNVPPPTSDSEVIHAELTLHRTSQLYIITFLFILSLHIKISTSGSCILSINT